MLDLLAAISSVDPPSLLAWLILAFAAAGYPLGIMLGASCSPCCGCAACAEGSLPETLTVTFSGLADQTPGPDLIALSFTSCYGSGASATVTAPGGDPATDKGAIGAVTVTNGGSGYAVLGRVAPTLTVSGGSGTGATFTPTLSQSPDACGLARWAISSIAASGGTDYADGDALTITIADGDTEVQAASATVRTTRSAPTITATANGGSGAALSVTTDANGTTPETWRVTGISVTSGGSGYPVSGEVQFNTVAGDVAEVAAAAEFRCGIVQPTVSFSAGTTGTGAQFTATFSTDTGFTSTPYYGATYYQIETISVVNGGSGYVDGDLLRFTVTDGFADEYSYFRATATVNGSGVITAVTVTPWARGRFYKSSGVIESVVLSDGGVYYSDDGVIKAVTVQNGGLYCREDASEPPYVATVTVGITQTAPSTGTGASLSVTIDEDTGSETFGQITGVNIDNGGSGYLAHELFDTCLTRFDGRSIVVQRNPDAPCQYGFTCASPECTAESEQVFVFYQGPDAPISVELFASATGFSGYTGSSAQGFMESTSNVTDCSTINVSLGPSSGVPTGASGTISVGGEYAETPTCKTFTNEELNAMEAEITWRGLSWTAAHPVGTFPCGDSVQSYSTLNGEYCGRDSLISFLGTATCESAPTILNGVAGELQLRVDGCELKWKCPDLLLGEYRVQTHVSGASCMFLYTIGNIPVDAEGFPSGAVEVIKSQPHPSNADGTFCVDPGPPTVTFSRLP